MEEGLCQGACRLSTDPSDVRNALRFVGAWLHEALVRFQIAYDGDAQVQGDAGLHTNAVKQIQNVMDGYHSVPAGLYGYLRAVQDRFYGK